jgi:hypothetical protein
MNTRQKAIAQRGLIVEPRELTAAEKYAMELECFREEQKHLHHLRTKCLVGAPLSAEDYRDMVVLDISLEETLARLEILEKQIHKITLSPATRARIQRLSPRERLHVVL